jgi:hypothetical protein
MKEIDVKTFIFAHHIVCMFAVSTSGSTSGSTSVPRPKWGSASNGYFSRLVRCWCKSAPNMVGTIGSDLLFRQERQQAAGTKAVDRSPKNILKMEAQ